MGDHRVLGTCIDTDEVYDLLTTQSQTCLLMMVDSIAADHGEELVQRLRLLEKPPVVLLLVDDLCWIRPKRYPLDTVDAVILTRSFGTGVLVECLTAMQSGDQFVDPAITVALQSRTCANAVQLTNREFDTLRELAEGLTNRQIGARLGLAETTVRDYVRSLMIKLEATNRTQVLRRALEIGLLDYTSGLSIVA